MIDFQYIKTNKLPIRNTPDWLKKVVSSEGKKIGKIVYVFCPDEYLAKKNMQFLNHDTLTDVITFDYCKGEIVNGDVLISTERVSENAKLFEVDFLTELHRVMVHGLLHLLGYKDKTKEEAELMRSKENYYLSIK
jgi:rRNA maturation RNase YbeY